MKSDLDQLSIGVLSFRAHDTLRASMERYAAAGLTGMAAEFTLFFNAMDATDRELAQTFGVKFHGTPGNTGIYGGFRRIAEQATGDYVLILENDVVPLNVNGIAESLASSVRDMKDHGVRVFSLRSRAEPGQGAPWQKYVKCFPVLDPIASHLKPQPLPVLKRTRMVAEHGYVSKFRSAALFVEKNPEMAQPKAIRKLPSGNYLTDSRFRNWSNQALLVDRRWFLDEICARVESHPDTRLVNGAQDIERAINSRWWRRKREPMGHAASGIFTHRRLSR